MRSLSFAHSFEVYQELPPQLKNLRTLAMNLRWTWHQPTQDLFSRINHKQWEESEHNPIKLLNQISQDTLLNLSQDEVFLTNLNERVAELEKSLSSTTWFDEKFPGQKEAMTVVCIGESFSLHPSITAPITAESKILGDHIKAASDLGIPMIAIGLFDRKSLTSQTLDSSGHLSHAQKEFDLFDHPMTLLQNEKGETLKLSFIEGDIEYNCLVWKVLVGRISLYLLEETTNQSNREEILGIGSIELLKELNTEPTVLHLFGSVAKLALNQRVTQFINTHNCAQAVAEQCIQAGTIKTILSDANKSNQDFLDSGALISLTKSCAESTKEQLADNYSDFPVYEIPVASVTHGTHTLSGFSPRLAHLFEQYFGKDWTLEAGSRNIWGLMRNIPDIELWETKEDMRGDFVRYCRRYLAKSFSSKQPSSNILQAINSILDPRILTVGLKIGSGSLNPFQNLLKDPERLKNILFNQQRPMQIVCFGHASPNDHDTKQIIEDLHQLIEVASLRSRFVYLEEINESDIAQISAGVDLWLNPAINQDDQDCTLGMSVITHGGLNLATDSGWWSDAHRPGLGWKLDASNQNCPLCTSQTIYELLEGPISQIFYHRVEDGLPTEWVDMMKKSMSELAPYFNTHRVVREYTSRFYLPASHATINLKADECKRAKNAVSYKEKIAQHWEKLVFVKVTDTLGSSANIGTKFSLTAHINLGDLDPAEVRVQALFGKVSGSEMKNVSVYDLNFAENLENSAIFKTEIECSNSGHQGYTVRVVPKHPDIRIPQELNFVKWMDS